MGADPVLLFSPLLYLQEIRKEIMSGDNYYNDGISYTAIIPITESDSTEYNVKAFQVTDDTGGNIVSIKTSGMSAQQEMYAIKGVIYPVGGKSVIFHTDTTATTIIGLR